MKSCGSLYFAVKSIGGMGSLRTFAYGQLGGFYGKELAEQTEGNRRLKVCFYEQGRDGPVQAPLPLAGRTTHEETFSSKQLWKPTLPKTPATVASHMHPAITRGPEPTHGMIVWDQPERLRPWALRGMADKNKSQGAHMMGAPSEPFTHYEKTFKGHSASAVEPPVPPPKNNIPPPGNKRLFSGYTTSTGTEFNGLNLLGTKLSPAKGTQNHTDDSSSRGSKPAHGAIVSEPPERPQPDPRESPQPEEKGKSGNHPVGIPTVKSSHTHEAFRGHFGSFVEPPVPAPKGQIPLPDKRLFTSYQTSFGRDFDKSDLDRATAVKGIKTYIDDTSRVMGAQIPNRVRDILIMRHSQSTETIQSLPDMIDIMPQGDLVRKLLRKAQSGHVQERGSRPSTAQSGQRSKQGSRPSSAPCGGRGRLAADSGKVLGKPGESFEKVRNRPATAQAGRRKNPTDRDCSHTHEAFRAHSVSAVEPPVPPPRSELQLPDKRLFTSYETSMGRDFPSYETSTTASNLNSATAVPDSSEDR